MTPEEKEQIQAVQQMSKQAMMLANSATEFVMNESPIARIDLDQKIKLMEACVETAKKVRGKPPEVTQIIKPNVKNKPSSDPEPPIVLSKKNTQEFIQEKEKVKFNTRFIPCVLASNSMDDRTYAVCRSKDNKARGKVTLEVNGFRLKTPMSERSGLPFIEVLGTDGIVKKVHAQLFSEE